MNSASSISSLLSRYFCTAFLASSEINTTRTFSPFPRTDISSSLRLMSLGSAQSSETRKPVEKSSSSIALSRSPRRVEVSGALSSRSSSSIVIRSSDLSGTFASSIRSGEREVILCRARYFRNALRAIR